VEKGEKEMNEENLKKLVDRIIREGVPLFTRESIEKMLRRMNKETEEDLRCCGNCNLFSNKGKYYCKDNHIHIDHSQPWKVCPEWKFDEADIKRRMGIVAKKDN
jgi:hypothetical protein